MADEKILAIAGQPNCGKSTIFNAITGLNQTIGNWPGVTVERKEGKISTADGENIRVIDLPGVYGLSPISDDERVTRDYLLDQHIDLIVNIIDGNNLERGLFLTLQMLMLNIPMILVINMADIMEKKHIHIDIERLKYLLGTKVIPVSGRTRFNIDYLREEINQFFSSDFTLRKSHISIPGDDKIYSYINNLNEIMRNMPEIGNKSEFFALKILEGNRDIENRLRAICNEDTSDRIMSIADSLGDISDRTINMIEWLFGISRGIVNETLKEDTMRHIDLTDVADIVFLNRFISIPIFFLAMFGLFTVTYYAGDFIASLFENGFIYINSLLSGITGNNFLDGLITEGIVTGVGNVLSLLPYIFIMFMLIQLLEDSGYMARVAFIMDRFMHKIGLHGRSFIPIIMGFGCSVPAIMATRTMETRQNKLKTMMIIPFIPCSARLTVIVMLGSALFDDMAPFIIFSLYILSVIIAVITGLLLSKTMLKEESEGMIMELPDYRWPQLKNLFIRAGMQSKEYLTKAGTLIFAISVVIFILSYFPANTDGGFIAILGRFIYPLFKPLDFDIPMTISLITGFFAKESIIATLSVLYGTVSVPLSDFIAMNWSVSGGIVFMVFMMIYIPCLATVAIIYQESRSFKWVAFSIFYSTIIAYAVSWLFKLIVGCFI